MVEPISIIGGIAAITQLAKYGFRFIQSASDYPVTFRDAPNTIKGLMNDVEGFLSIAQSLGPRPHEIGHSTVLYSIIDRSISSATSLQRLLQTVAIDASDSRSVRLKKSLSFQRKAKRISKSLLDIERCRGNLNLHISMLLYQGNATRNTMPPDTPISSEKPGSMSGIVSDLPRKFNFIGRSSILNSVSQNFSDPALGRKTCLVGLGGIGKTQAALECVYCTRKSTPDVSIFWIDASNQASFRKSFEGIVDLVMTRGSSDSDVQDIQFVIDWLESSDSGRWIMVIDDIDLGTFGNRQLFHDALPVNNNGFILFTTRNKQTALSIVDNPRCILQMELMTYTEAYHLLKSQLDTEIPDTALIASLLTHLDHLPLAICRAASYMMMTSTPPNAYLRLSRESEESRADFLDHPISTTPEGHETPLSSLLVSIDAIRGQNEDAAQMLFKIACGDPLHIPSTLIASGSTSGHVARALGLLKAYSLIASNDTGELFNVHSLVHLGIRSYLKMNNQFYLHASDVFQTLARLFPETKEQYNKLIECKLYLPHALAAWDAVTATGKTRLGSHINSDTAKTLASRISLYLRIMGRYEEAKRYAEHALEWCLDENDPLSAPTLACRISIVAVDQYLGNITIAAESINLILRSQTHLRTTNSPSVIPTLRRKGLSLQSQAHYAQAESYHRSAVHMSISLYGVDDIQTLDEKHGLALSLLGQRKQNEALSLLQYVLEAMGDTIGPKNPKTLSVLSNVGGALQLQGRWTQSWACITQALAGREEVLGADHPHTLQCKANLAQIYVERGEPEKAEETTRDVLQSHQAKLGKDHPLSVHILQNLGFLLLDQCKYWEAEEILRCVVRKREKSLGVQHSDTLLAMFYLADAYCRQEKFEDALTLGRKVLCARRGVLPRDHPDVLGSEVQVAKMEQTYEEWLSSRTLVDCLGCTSC